MKKRMIVVLLACAAMVAASPSLVRAQVNISASIQINSPSDFYQPLEPYGSWVDVQSYGRCWHPRDVSQDWQPYTDGHWEWTDAGWYWASDEPWGWACCHYGSWYNDPRYGWVWIPATDWAPAWVTWRTSDDYIGWAPCGPGLSVLAPSFFTFCDVHKFQDHFHSRGDFIVNNTRIINRTKVIKDFHRQSMDFDGHQRTVFANRGPGVEPIQRATGRTFTPRPVRDVVRETRSPENVRRDNNQRQDQKPADQRRETPAPTGRDNQRNYQQPDNRQPQRNQTPPIYQTPQQQQQNRDRTRESQPQNRPEATPPTGRDQSRTYREPTKSETPTPATPQRKEVQPQQQRAVTPAAKAPAERPLPPTGRNDVKPAQPVRPPQEVPKPAPEQRREVPAPQTRPEKPAERPLPPTGRDEVRPPVQAPAARPAPPVKQQPIPADGHGRDGRDKRDGNQQ
jgi:hypothetical protein